MKLKLDENIGLRAAQPLLDAGYDVSTVARQEMTSAADRVLLEACRREERCLVTLDREFGNPLIFDPSIHAGIALLRLPGTATPAAMLACMTTLAEALHDRSIEHRLWIVQPGRFREYQPE